MDSSYILWNKFQDYQLKFNFNKPFFGNKLASFLLTARQQSYQQEIFKYIVIVVQ